MTNLEQQIEAAYHYRGNVTVTLKNGSTLEGFLFNREFTNPKIKEDRFVELYLAGSGDYQKLSLGDMISVTLTGEDHAAGKSYHEWLEKEKTKTTAV